MLAATANTARLKLLPIIPAPSDTAPRRPLRPRLFGRVRLSVAEQRIVAGFVDRVNAIADSAQCRFRYGSDRQARIRYGFSQAATTKRVMLVILALMLSMPEMPVCSFFDLLESWNHSIDTRGRNR
jgi:hypothetical protein